MTIDPSAHDPRNLYKMMTGLIVPRPIAFVSTLSRDGRPNLAPFSFFTVASAHPPVICFAPLVRRSDAERKDTLINIEACKEFVVNIVSEEFAEQMNLCSVEYPPEVNEFEVSGLTPVPSDLVAPPRVAQSRASMECRLHSLIEISTQPLGGTLVLGTVLRFHVDDALFTEYRIDQDRLGAIGRLGGNVYARTTDRFELVRPKAGEIQQS